MLTSLLQEALNVIGKRYYAFNIKEHSVSKYRTHDHYAVSATANINIIIIYNIYNNI